MSPDPASLQRLHDIVVPQPAPWWPPAPGWLWLLGVLAMVAVVLLIRAFARWQRNRYRRQALAELTRLSAARQESGRQPPDPAALAALLKRTALTAYPREMVATLTGQEWFAFLDRTGGTRFGAGLGAALEAANYHAAGDPLDASRLVEIAAEVEHWIRHHDAMFAAVGTAVTAQPSSDVRRPA
jgi:hypothetical protein